MNFYPSDYLHNRDLCSENFHAQDFAKNELHRKSLAVSNYLKLAFYPILKKAIENNSVEEIKLINNNMTRMGFHLKDFNPNSSLNDYIQGERYTPLLFLAFRYRSIAPMKCLVEMDIPLTGHMYRPKLNLNQNFTRISFHSNLEEPQRFDIIDMINNLEDGDELKSIFKQELRSTETVSNENAIEGRDRKDSNAPKLSKRQQIIKNFLKRSEPNENTQSGTCTLL